MADIIDNNNSNNSSVTSNSNGGERRFKKPSNRPALQIYRPPGLRNSEDATNTKPNVTAGAKQFKKDTNHQKETNGIVNKEEDGPNNSSNGNNNNRIINNNKQQRSTQWNTSMDRCTKSGAEEHEFVNLSRADSALSNESTASSQTSERSHSARKNLIDSTKKMKRSTNRNSFSSKDSFNGLNAFASSDGNDRVKKDTNKNISSAHKDSTSAKRKTLTTKEIEDLAANLRKLDFGKENSVIEQFISSNFSGDGIGESVGQMLVHLSIEENRQASKTVARIAAQLLESSAARIFYQGTIAALMHYFECRERLRADHFRIWIAFLNFVSDLYTNIGYVYEGELVDLVFQIFDYMLKAPVLDTLKIEELESLIGCLLSAGYDLERQCPEKLAVLKDLIRDAFVEVQEPWARKMILLLLELGASGWKLPPEANEYYFQHTSS